MNQTATIEAPDSSNTTSGLTTTNAPFIETAQERGELFIAQPYDLYSEDNQEAWRRLYARLLPRWRSYAHPRFLEGVENLALSAEAVPRLEDINRFLAPLSGFEAKAVSGYVPAYLFFDCLRRREFPTTITIRDKNSLDYLPEPDIFHDVAGHVPMHTDRQFSDVLVRFGEVARQAAFRAKAMPVREERIRVVESNIKALARFFWFTVEFGLMRKSPGSEELRVYGSGLLSSFGEIEHAIESSRVQRFPFQLEWVINQYFEIDHYQPLLFVVDSFADLFAQVERLERWLVDGKLDSVSPGEPAINEEDLRSFLNASITES
ncbi:MAG: phenylalanine 4-monooxygenase [Thermoanaerobaculia bacterium]|nr:phenylalanine 4-monooxygenase [Thermoanaerobaculia bacterium]